ncbi:NAD-dependent succinate-semialdehyde dehydrogenase [Methanolobus sp. ZRKC3]|uniref:NAD-dependent succinate-semialdehyde dehydrogenase n=1 Tax=Methanolobus sp. ZRKC3 TaxID=3125786 RepID=UPI003243CA84
MTTISSINPASGKVIREFKLHSEEKVNHALRRSTEAFKEWKETDVHERTELLRNVSKLLRERKQEYGELITTEMGKVIKQSVPEIAKCADTFDYFADNVDKILEPEYFQTDASSSMVCYEPVGTVLAIKPWNFPFWQVLSAASHVLAGGNTMLLKHSSYVPGCALEIEKLFLDAGFPEGVFQTLLIDGRTASSLISRKEIAAVSFTGGYNAGREVAQAAAWNMKKFVLELGGSDPFIVLEDADVEKAAQVAVPSRFINTGQTCIAAKRFIVAESVAHRFTEKFTELTENLKIGDPMDPETDVGPLVSKEQVNEIREQVRDAIAKGADPIVSGGEIVGEGFMYSPTVLADVKRDMKVMHEETFGPVAPIITFKTEEEAIEIANDSEFGLGASIWSRDQEKATTMAAQLETGMVGVNAFFRPEACMPFGGVKKSGMGRELSRIGFHEFMNIKSLKVY